MTLPVQRPATADGLFLWIIHRFAEVFGEHAILKGGMAMRLIDSPCSTTDIDYVFAPYASIKEIGDQVASVLGELDEAEIEIALHSKMLRAEIRLDAAAIQLEASVAMECESIPISTGGFARGIGQTAQIVRIMSLDWALAQKLAAWNERRLLRDLYDCYFFVGRLGELPKPEVLDHRLAHVDSRIPGLSGMKTMSRGELARALRDAVANLEHEQLAAELGGLLPNEELAGLVPRIRATTVKIAEWLEGEVS